MNPRLLIAPVLLLSFGVAVAQEDVVKKEFGKLKGTWSIIASEQDKKAEDEEKLPKFKVVFKGNELTVTDENLAKNLGKITLVIDPATTPKCIDLKIEAQNKVVEGIYELKGDDLTLCICNKAATRPAAFDTEVGSERVLFKLKREKE